MPPCPGQATYDRTGMKLTRRHRQVLAVLAVTTALCADQVSAAAPSLRPQVADLAGRLVTRLTQSFGRTVAGATQLAPRQQTLGARVTPGTPVRSVEALSFLQHQLSPLQFRLPPPAL